MEHSEQVRAYTAGLMDGEGCIVIGVSKRKRVRGIVPDHWLQVGITGTDRELIDWLHETFGGHISDNSHCPSRRRQRPCWAWRIMSNQASDFLKLILPYLKVKTPQATLAIEFQDNRVHHTGRLLTSEVIERRNWYKDEISAHNIGPRTIPS